MSNEMEEELLEKIKNAIDITFDDEEYDQKVIGFIEDGIPFLRLRFGCKEDDEIDWCAPGDERMLLKNYCLYAINNMTSDFADAYRSEIINVRERYEVQQWKKENSTTTSTE